MKKAISKLAASVAIASLPMTGIASATLVLSADIAIAAGKSGDKGKSADKGKGKSGDKSTGKPETANKGSEASARKGLNSLRRNINGLMNSSDPKMEGFRSFVLANAALSEATDLLALAQGEFDAAQADYDSLELSGTATDDLAGLQAELDGLVEPDPDTATQEEIDAYNAAVEILTASIQVVEAYLIETDELAVAVQGVTDATVGTSEEDKLQAFVDAMHAAGQTDFTVDDITEDMLELFQKHLDSYSG